MLSSLKLPVCVSGDCIWGFTEHEGHCYAGQVELLSWSQAEANCAEYNAHVASIHSQEENDFVRGKHLPDILPICVDPEYHTNAYFYPA